MGIPFTKMHGLGNDFVVLDTVRNTMTVDTDLVRKMSDRHFGIGCDQVLVIAPPKTPGTDFFYRIFNKDGTEVAQCGNGARCLGRLLRDTGCIPEDTQTVVLGTKKRNITVHYLSDGSISLDMGPPIWDPESVPFYPPTAQKEQHMPHAISTAVGTFELQVLHIGNPHAVMLCTDVQSLDVDLLGSHISTAACFKEGVNVGFMQVIDSSTLRLRVYERGAKETLACGSGACAAMVAARIRGTVRERVTVQLPGGNVKVSWQGSEACVWLSGPTETVFTGNWQLET